jgi:EGF-domain serine glucosyl/xylosyltransferase
MMPKGYRLSFAHLAFYITSFIIATQLWTIWRQTGNSYFSSYVSSDWHFNADEHANIHTLSQDQCNVAFPKAYYSLDKSVSRRQGRKVHVQDIEIAKGRCMFRVMVYEGEV